MLVLTRKSGEGIYLGKDVTIEIISVEKDRVSIGIAAPREVRIYRKELLDETINANKSAVDTKVVSLKFGR